MYTPYTRNGVTVQALQVGRYIVVSCCPRPDNPHAVVHVPSDLPLICGLTQEAAVMVADAVSLYAPDYPGALGELGPALARWIREVMETGEAYVTFHERVYGRRPVPWQPPDWGRRINIASEPGFKKMQGTN
jgi:hypothetical protein